MKPKISVIVPIYGVECFIERCVRSLMEQSLHEGLEFIFVDDCSKDASQEILERIISEYPIRKDQIILIHHNINKGLPAARNTGLAHASGNYIYHFDGDDYAEPELLARMLEIAERTNADYIWSDWLLSYEHTDRLMKQPDFKNTFEALCGVLKGQMKYNVWNKIVKRKLYVDNNIIFPEGHGMGEDMTMIKLLSCAKSVAYVNYAGYHYVKTNNGAMTSNMNDASYLDVSYNVDSTIQFLRKIGLDSIEPLMEAFKLHTKFPLLFSTDRKNYKRWYSLWPESNQYIKSAGFNRRNRYLNYLADKRLWALIKAHFILYNFAYKIIHH